MSVRTSDTGKVALKEALRRRKLTPGDHQHPVNVVHHDEASFGEMLADTLEHAAAEAEKADEQNVEILLAIKQNTEVTVKILQHVEALVSDHLAQPKT